MAETDIVCPLCGGSLEYWKEYLVTKTQSIFKNGTIARTVKTSKPEEVSGMRLEGFQCTKCNWVFNNINEIDKMEKYPHLEEWFESHDDEIKV